MMHADGAATVQQSLIPLRDLACGLVFAAILFVLAICVTCRRK